MIRLAIAGGPRTGKTTLASRSGCATVRGTDALKGLGWSEASLAASQWFDEPDGCGGTCVEGVAVPRALRKWLAFHAGDNERPCERVLYLTAPVYVLADGATPPPIKRGQASMAKGCWTVWHEIRPELERRGVVVEYLP